MLTLCCQVPALYSTSEMRLTSHAILLANYMMRHSTAIFMAMSLSFLVTIQMPLEPVKLQNSCASKRNRIPSALVLHRELSAAVFS